MIKTPNDCVSDERQYSGYDDGVLVDAHESKYAVRLVTDVTWNPYPPAPLPKGYRIHK